MRKKSNEMKKNFSYFEDAYENKLKIEWGEISLYGNYI